MAGTDPQKHLLTLIRDFASEKSQGGTLSVLSPFSLLLLASEKVMQEELQGKSALNLVLNAVFLI